MMFSYIAPSQPLKATVRDYLIAHFLFDRETSIPLKAYAAKPEQGITFFVRGRPGMVSPITGEFHRAPLVSLFGQQVARFNVHLQPEFLMVRVHFQPGALFRLLSIPLYEFGENYFDAELVLGREAREVGERLAAARTHAEMIALVEEFLVRIVGKTEHGLHRVDRAASCLVTDPLHVSLDWLARQACLSPRQFNRKFTERMGVGPKLYSRLLRFQRAYQFKVAHAAVAWPRVALDCGYVDYQHMVRDFRQFTNASPNVWLEEDEGAPENVLARSRAAGPLPASS
jgi:AraC-like DNA-binding protein